MQKKDKEDLVKIVTDGLNDIMFPALENLEKNLRADLASKTDIDRLERKLDANIDRLDRYGKQLEDHDKRIHSFGTISL